MTVREFGYLIEENEKATPPYLGNASVKIIPGSAFSYLLSLINDETSETDITPFLKLTTFKRKTALKVQNYVGVLQTPCGTSIEILPKLSSDEYESYDLTRDLLVKMLRTLRNSPFKKGEQANIRIAKMPLLEIYISQFLALTNQLVKRGIRSDYIRVHRNAAYLKGRMLVSEQIRKNLFNPERFAIEYDEYFIDRPANRLIKSTLNLIISATHAQSNQRLARELMFVFEAVPESTDVRSDFSRVKLNRNMSYYEDVLEWCKVLLSHQGPTASAGSLKSISLLYPMERIFEDYVADCLRKNSQDYFGKGATLKTQSSKHSLVEDHDGRKIFNLRPDLIVFRNNQPVCVLDTKWKLIDDSDRRNKYGISQSDMYQLYAYGNKCLSGHSSREVYLIYPKTQKFQKPLPDFKYEEGKLLRVVPFDINSGRLEWQRSTTSTSVL